MFRVMFGASRRNLVTFFMSLIVGLLCVPIAELLTKTSSPENRPKQILFGPSEIKPTQSMKASRPRDQEEVPRLSRGFCNDPKIKPIWNAIRRDKEVRDALDEETSTPDCRDIFEIRYVDLNRRGKKEILARVLSIPFCGAVGNCDLFVLEQTRKGLRLLLHANDYVDATEMGEQVLRKRTNGYLDILTKGHFSAAETSHTTYNFNGRKYVETNCKYSVPKYDNSGKANWEFISCKEFTRRQYRDLGK